MPTPTTSQELFLFSRKRLMTMEETFQALGWERRHLKIEDLYDPCVPNKPCIGDWRKLTGNMMAVPTMGAILACILSSLPFNAMTDFTSPRAE